MSSTQIDSLDIRIESTSKEAIAAIDALIQSFEKLKTAGNFKEIEKSLKKISEATNKGLKSVPATFNKAAKAADKFSDSAKGASKNTGGLGDALGNATSGLLQFIGNAIGINSIGDALVTSAQAAMEWEGISARFAEGFGDQVDEAYDHVMKLQDALFINDQQFMQYSSNFATLGRGMGVPSRAIKDMSIGLTELAYDIFAKNNDFYSLEESLDAVRSAYLGEIEPIRKAGISITEATLKEAAANYGLTMSVEKMTEAQKMQLRYKVMVDQAYASGTVGTYISEINTAEGAYRALGQQIKGLAQTIGGLLMPVVSAVLPYIQAFISLITAAIRAVGGFFGINIKAPTWSSGMNSLASSAGGASEAVENTTNALGGAAKAAKKLKDYTMGFDELNVIKPQQDTSGGGGGAAGGGGIGGDLGLDMNSLWTDAMIEEATMKADAIAQKVIAALQPIKEAILAIDFKPLTDSLKRLWKAFKPFAKKIGQGLYWFLMNVLVPLAGYTIENILPDFINLVASGLEKAVPLMDEFGAWVVANKDSIVKVTGYVVAFFLAFKAVSLITGALSTFGGLKKVVSGTGSVFKGLNGFVGKLLLRGQSLAIIFGASGGGLGGVFSVLSTIGSSLISAVFSPLSLIVVAVAATASVLAANWDKVVQVFKTFIEGLDLPGKFNAIKEALAPLTEKLAGLQDLFTVIGTVGAGILAVAMSVVAGVFNAVLTAIPPLIDAVGGVIDILAGLGSFIVGIFTGDLEKVTESLQKIWDGITGLFGGLWEAVGGAITGFVNGVIEWFKSLWDTLVGHSIVPDTIDAIVEWFASLPGKIFSGLASFVQTVINWFKTMWKGVTDTWKGIAEWFGTLLTKAWANIQSAWAGAVTWFSSIWSNIKNTFTPVAAWFKTQFTNAWTNIKNAWSSVKTWFSNMWTNIKTVFTPVNTWFKDKFTTAWTNIKTAWSSVKTWFSNIWTGIKNTFSTVNTWFKTKFQSAWTNIKSVFSGWQTFFSGLWTKIKNTFSTLGTSLGNAIGGSVKTAINRVISWVESTINKAVGIINKAIGVINEIPGVEVGKLSTIRIPRMATGGFVDEGQMFIAREAGAEMVGSMNNRTAVANNDQIVEGISAGVYSAVVAAMSQTNGSKTPSINVYLDGRQITAAVEKHQRERGANIMTGGVTFGY